MLDEEGQENGKPAQREVREEGAIDFAFFKSHEFSVLLDHGDPLEGIGGPPYSVEGKKEGESWETDELLELHAQLLEVGQKGLTIQRYKGLGEMNADQLKITTMDPESRTMLRVVAENENVASGIFEKLMGDQVDPRKKFIEKHAADVRNLDI